jgi:putative ABC transport system permease protein
MTAIARSWIWSMALREARHGIKSMLLPMLCVVLGVTAVVASFSFRANLQSGIRMQSKTLLGADLAIQSREPFTREAEALIASIGGKQSRQVRFSSMAYFPQSGKSRLVQVRALSGGFPFYGALETEPATAAKVFQSGPNALVDETLMLQFNSQVGERVRIGEQDFRIAGKLRKIPGESLAFSLLSPRIYIPLAFLGRTGLIQKGSLVRYRVYFQLAPTIDADQLAQRLSPRLSRLHLEADTVNRRTASISRSMENLSRYLQLAVFIAVLLAGVGVASGIHVHTKNKTPSVAVLRCIGASPNETLYLYVIQALMIALVGTLLGALLGAGMQSLISIALQEFLPVTASVSLAPKGILAGMAVGLGTTLLFALIPIVSLRKISPLSALRTSYEVSKRYQDPVLWVIFFLIAMAVLTFALAITERWLHALIFTGAVFGAFALLAFLAKSISTLLRKLVPDILPFPWRQGLANLHRPNNQTTVVMLAIGLGAFFLVTLYSVRSMLVNQVIARSGRDEPNIVLFDVQKDQRQGIASLLRSLHLRAHGAVPIVTMRLTAIKGRRVEALRANPNSTIPRWALRREYRSTYRAVLTDTEQIVQGTWRGRVASNMRPIPISLEKGIAATLAVTLGDTLEFEIQGVPFLTEVASIREVDWQRVQPNFFVVFPEGVLESAPQFYALVTRADSARVSANLQRAVVQQFPNVSVIDLSLILNTLDSILTSVSDAVRFIALFTILTGFAVLASAVLNSRSQRLKESILLKTLGAPRSQIITAIVAEYVFLGLIACAAGALLAMLASWGLTFYFLGTVAKVSWAPVLSILILISAATVLVGVLGCWGIFRRSALEALRVES